MTAWFMEGWFIPRGRYGTCRLTGNVFPKLKNNEYNLRSDGVMDGNTDW